MTVTLKCRFRSMIVLATFLIPSGILPVQAMPSSCACQAVLVCGADDCSSSEEDNVDGREGCRSVTASIDTVTNDLSICAFGDCWTGTATAIPVGNMSTFWHGGFTRNDDANYTPSQIGLLLDNGVGFAQISDESGPLQVSLICDIKN
jgi:hypothetical protein